MIKPDHLTLGEVITALSAHDPDKRLKVGFRHPHSWRGDYSELAFEAAENVTVRDMLDEAKTAVGTTFQGWKGGDYTMDADTFVWLVREEGTSDGETVGMLLLNLMLANTAEPTPVLHVAEMDTPMREGYAYRATGVGVREDLIQEVLNSWATLSPAGDPTQTLRSCGGGAIMAVDNIARIAVEAVAKALMKEPARG